MEKKDNWQPANICNFELDKEGPYLDSNKSIPTRKNLFNEKVKNGYQEGIRKAEAELLEFKKSFEDICNSIIKPLQENDEKLVQSLTNLSILVAKQIIRRELLVDSNQVVSVVKEAIKLLPLEKNRLIIHLNPRDISIIRKVFSEDDFAESYSLVEDPSIDIGGCKIATEDSVIDATIETQVAQIAANIMGSQRSEDRSNDK